MASPRISRLLASELNILLNLIFANGFWVILIRLNSVGVLNFLMNIMNLNVVETDQTNMSKKQNF